jgi:hypothetical protein
MGGQAAVIARAPVHLARPLGAGVWLQLSAVPPAPADATARLTSYLAPLLGWTAADAWGASGPPRVRVRSSLERGLDRASPAAPAPSHRRIPVRFVDEDAISTGVIVHLAARPDARGTSVLADVVARWYEDGAAGAFDGYLHELGFPSVDGSVASWMVDFGSADSRRAVEALADRLSAIRDPRVLRLVVGTPLVG